jgi:hypothetical protein
MSKKNLGNRYDDWLFVVLPGKREAILKAIQDVIDKKPKRIHVGWISTSVRGYHRYIITWTTEEE